MKKEEKKEKNKINTRAIAIVFTIILLVAAIITTIIAYASGDETILSKKTTTTATPPKYLEFSSIHTIDNIRKFAEENNIEVKIVYETTCNPEDEGYLVDTGKGYTEIIRDNKVLFSTNQTVKEGDIIVANICKK